ncbi:MAG TPA: T9SS type A sorting domain-containing protein [Bacteroidia bacterium]|nr:T9SS type A sorting domain-containing protein [Bacteroidia bacterium]
MKKIYFIAAAVLGVTAASGQCSVVVTQQTNVSCFGSCNGSVQLTTVGVPNYTYSWMPGGQTIQNPNNLCPGTHTVTMTDANNCQATATVTITEPTDISLSASATAVTCNGLCNGQAQVTASGGTIPYSYQWNNPHNSTTDTANSLCPGSYTCTVTDFNGCSKFTAVTITEPQALIVTSATNNASCNGACDGSAVATPSGGTPGYSYAWSSGCTTASCSNLCAGNYAVTVTDANNCSFVDSLAITQPTAVNPNATETDASCSTCANGTASAAPSGGTGPYTYMWSPGNQTTPSISGLSPGNYTVCVMDANGCSDCDTVTVSALSGITELSGITGLKLFPNPTSSFINIQLSKNAILNVTLYDVTGKIIFAEIVTSSADVPKAIDISGQCSGVYYLKVEMNGKQQMQKIVKL